MKDGLSGREGKQRTLFQFDLPSFLSMITLMVIGVLFIYSSNVTYSVESFHSRAYIHQIIWIAGGLIIYFLLQMGEYESYGRFAHYIYGGGILLLLITLLWGKTVNGARSWLGIFGFGIQPSEFMKVASILMLSSFYRQRKQEIGSLSTYVQGGAIILLPFFLVILQPDLGTSLVYIPIFLAVSYVAGTKKRYNLFLLLSGLLLVLFAVLPVMETFIIQREIGVFRIFKERELLVFTAGILFVVALLAILGFAMAKKRYFYWMAYGFSVLWTSLIGSFFFRIFLKDYQIMRLIVFLKPEVDPRGSGWNIIQSLTAVGSGGLTGKGYLQGTQSHYQYLPQRSTDFIFSIIAEEWGFLGSFLVLGLFSLILIRGVFIILNARDSFAVLLGSGILSMIFFHMMVNIGMAIGIMPITGIPLFFLSYGGSSLWTAVAGMALLQNIYLNRYTY